MSNKVKQSSVMSAHGAVTKPNQRNAIIAVAHFKEERRRRELPELLRTDERP